MTRRWYLRTTLAQMRVGTYKSVRAVKTGMMTIPAGAVVKITGKGGGLSISGPECKHCGVRIYAMKVPPHDLEPAG